MFRHLSRWLRRLVSPGSETRPKKHQPSELDATLTRVMEQVNAPINALRGDGEELRSLIRRIEETTRRGVSAMKGTTP